MRQAGVRLAAAAALVALAGCIEQEVTASGGSLYASYCAACHGTDGRGGAGGPDLSRLSARAQGDFPLVEVLAKIDGYTRDPADGMPEFGALLSGPTVPVETGPDVLTPTPVALVALADHLRTLQR
ncbi:MAG: c-type cytochrome [Rhodobacteraceae bacterium]|nr:c-type cytochrome [Paracoccaceae bacterium]